MKLLLVLNPEKATEEEVSSYPVREAARAVVFDKKGKIALLHVKNHKYYKLPGGGIESDEDKTKALKRECKEEVGSEIEILGEIGKIIEYRKVFNLKQISYCYFAKLKGKKGNPMFTDEEVDDGFEQIWLPYNEAFRLLSKNVATSIEGSAYIVPRDTAFLKESGLGKDVELKVKKGEIKIMPATKNKKVDTNLIISEKALTSDWSRKEEDEAWKNLK